MELNSRKIKILQAIILSYLESAEPVGSRTISKQYDLGVSSATIRNEMADLEDLGLIIQPHTSAGRIPSDKGYRLYVDHLMKYKEYQEGFIKDILLERVDRLEVLLQEIARVLANQTSYASVITTPQYQLTKIKHIQLVPIDENSVITIVVVEGNLIKNHLLTVQQPINEVSLKKINEILNRNLQGLSIKEINLVIIEQMKHQAGSYRWLIDGVLDAVINTVKSVEDIDVYTSGTTNILKCPEFSDIEKAAELLYTIEEKKLILSLINESIQSMNEGISIRIGNENPLKSLEECSLITTTYHLGEDTIGAIGIIGPKRMDYVRVVSMLNHMMKQLDKLWNNS